MFKISRSEQFVTYFWTGSNWSTKATDAKEFNSETDARTEMREQGIVYTVTVTPVK